MRYVILFVGLLAIPRSVGAQAGVGSAPPGTQVATPVEDPERLRREALEAQLKELKRREQKELPPEERLSVLEQIISISIELDSDYSSFEAKQKETLAVLRKQTEADQRR